MNWQPLFAERVRHMRRSTVRELLKALHQPGMISFAGGIPAAELFPVQETAQAVAAVLQRHASQALQYGETEGIRELRDWIAARFSRPQCQVRRENVLIVTGSQQALDLIGKVFLNAGDRVLVENPTYLAMLSAWRPWLPTFVPLPADQDGMCVAGLPPLLAQGAKLLYLVPNFQNPQGTTLSLERRRQLVQFLREAAAGQPSAPGAACARGVKTVLIEDNPYGDLRYSGEGLPHLLELDASSGPDGALETGVIHLGTFSKTLAPGLRVGWVIAPAEVIDKLVQAKQAADLHTSTLCQHVVLELVRNGVLERQLPKLCAAYRLRRDAMLGALAKYFPAGTTWTHPEGGMFLLVTLPRGCQTRALLQRALAQQVAFVPGDDFHLDGTGENTMRLNFSNAAPEQIQEGVRRLAALVPAKLQMDTSGVCGDLERLRAQPEGCGYREAEGRG